MKLVTINNMLRRLGLVLSVTHPTDSDDPTPTEIKLEHWTKNARRKRLEALRKNTYNTPVAPQKPF